MRAGGVWFLRTHQRQGDKRESRHYNPAPPGRWWSDRNSDSERGRAIAFASLGFTVGEAILPIIAVYTLALIGWRWTYGAAAILIGLTVIPTVIWLLKGHDTVHSRHIKVSKTVNNISQLAVRSWTRREVIRDYLFYLLNRSIKVPE